MLDPENQSQSSFTEVEKRGSWKSVKWFGLPAFNEIGILFPFQKERDPFPNTHFHFEISTLYIFPYKIAHASGIPIPS